jgi:hypothetical protein
MGKVSFATQFYNQGTMQQHNQAKEGSVNDGCKYTLKRFINDDLLLSSQLLPIFISFISSVMRQAHWY